MILLDTNVISEFFTQRPSRLVVEWLNSQEPDNLFLSSIVIAEMYFGAFLVGEEARGEQLLAQVEQVRDEYSARTLVFGGAATKQYGLITANRQRAGHRMETKDAMIAAICIVHGATLATRNTCDFDGLDLKLVNPFEAVA